MDANEIPCQCCGLTPMEAPTDRTFTAASDHRGFTFLCSFCEGLIDAGMLRPEVVDGELRYRQWFPEWKPGQLVAKTAAMREP